MPHLDDRNILPDFYTNASMGEVNASNSLKPAVTGGTRYYLIGFKTTCVPMI